MRAPAHFALGDKTVLLLPDGRVIVTLPATAMPFGCAMSATALYPSLAAFIAKQINQRSVRR